MQIIKPSVEIMSPNPHITGADILRHIERCGRTCYKSEDKITEDSAARFVAGLIQRGHEAMLEHASITAKFVCDRGVSHEVVRHRLASYAQESTRYCNYSQEKFGNEITVIEPCYLTQGSDEYTCWKAACKTAEAMYFSFLRRGCTPQEARAVLPNSLKTELVVTMNLREWRHFFKLRAAGTTGAPHPQMREVAVMALKLFKKYVPVVFDNIEVEEGEPHEEK